LRKLRWLPWVLAGALLSACAQKPPQAQFGSGLKPAPSNPQVLGQEREMFRLLNRDRQASGLKPLAYDERLADIARSHSLDMREHKFFDHISPNTGSPDNRLDAAGYRFRSARENLSEAPDVKSSQAGLMLSPHHHENIMAADVTHIGVGIVQGGVQDARNLTVTQLFATPGLEETLKQARQAILSSIGQKRAAASLPKVREEKRLSEIAEQNIDGLVADDLDATLEAAGGKIAEAVSQAKLSSVRAVLVGGQLLTDSGSFAPPPTLLEARASAFGLALKTVQQNNGRPMTLVLLVVGVN
jgi:uncharacterized protein YkwD